MKRDNGFTLIELMGVVVIAAILMSIAVPGYQSLMTKSKRSDAFGGMATFAAAMERFSTTNNSYRGAAAGGADTGAPAIFPTELPLESGSKYYDLSITAATDSAFTIRATPKNSQSDDGLIELNSLGIKSWDKNDDGDVADAGENNWEAH